MSPLQSIWAQKSSQTCPGGGAWRLLGTFWGENVPESSRVGTKMGRFVPDRQLLKQKSAEPQQVLHFFHFQCHRV